MKYSFNQLKSTGRYSFISDESSVNVHTPSKVDIQINHDHIVDVIFAPDPFTGYPSSDLGLLMSEKTKPEIQDYIKNYLCKPVQLPHGAPDPDIALDTLQSKDLSGRRYEEYVKGLQAYALKASQELETLNDSKDAD